MKLTTQVYEQVVPSGGTLLAECVCGKPRRSASSLFLLPRKTQSLGKIPRHQNLANRFFGDRRRKCAAIRPPFFPRQVLIFPTAGHLPPMEYKKMSDKLFDSSILGSMQESLDFITNLLQSSTEYSIIGRGMDGTILLWNEGEP